MELANMDLGDEQQLLGDGPENQQTNVKWVSVFLQTFRLTLCLKSIQIDMIT